MLVCVISFGFLEDSITGKLTNSCRHCQRLIEPHSDGLMVGSKPTVKRSELLSMHTYSPNSADRAISAKTFHSGHGGHLPWRSLPVIIYGAHLSSYGWPGRPGFRSGQKA
jgi:hypothetical protein